MDTTSGGCSTSRVAVFRTSSYGVRPVCLMEDLDKVALRIQERHDGAASREHARRGKLEAAQEAGANRGKRKPPRLR